MSDVVAAQQAGALELGLHERHVKDVRLALARALARSHIGGTAAAAQ